VSPQVACAGPPERNAPLLEPAESATFLPVRHVKAARRAPADSAENVMSSRTWLSAASVAAVIPTVGLKCLVGMYPLFCSPFYHRQPRRASPRYILGKKGSAPGGPLRRRSTRPSLGRHLPYPRQMLPPDPQVHLACRLSAEEEVTARACRRDPQGRHEPTPKRPGPAAGPPLAAVPALNIKGLQAGSSLGNWQRKSAEKIVAPTSKSAAMR